MLISYIGNETNLDSGGKSFNTERHIHLTLEKLGHSVRFIQENQIQPNTLKDIVAGSSFVLWTRTWDKYVTEKDLQEIKELGIPTVSVHLDKYTQIQRNGGIDIGSAFWKTTHIFSPEGSLQAKKVFEAHGISQHYLPPGVFADECYITDPVDQFKHELIFVGGGSPTGQGPQYGHKEWGYRGELLKFLQQTYGNRFVKYGWPQKTVRGHELNQLYSSAKLTIGDSLCNNFTDSQYFTDRYFESTGRGACLLAPYVPGITDHFADRKEIILYGYNNWVQLKNLIDYYLDENNAAEREAIRLAGHERTKAENTYTQRMTTMLSILRQEGAIE